MQMDDLRVPHLLVSRANYPKTALFQVSKYYNLTRLVD